MANEDSPDSPEETTSPGPPTDGGDGDTPLIEDAYEPAAPVDEVPAEDAPELLEGMARALEGEAEGEDEVDAETIEASKAAAARVADRDDDSDTAAIADDDEPSAKDRSSEVRGD